MTARVLTACSAMALVATACAEQGTVTVSASLPFAVENWSRTLSVPKFSKPLFNLDSVDVVFTGTSKGSLKLENRDPIARAYSARICSLLELKDLSGNDIVTVHPKCSDASGTLARFDGTVDFGGTSGVTFVADPQTASNNATLSGDALAPFVGDGTLDLPVSGTVTSNLTVSGNNTREIRSESAVDVQFVYHYSYTPASVGDRVWFDRNGNGVQDDGEMGLGGVAVDLLDASGNVVKSTTTDTNGAYKFDGLVPDVYQVRFNAPAGGALTGQGLGGDATKDSDADATTGKTVQFTLHSGDARTDVDAGVVGLQSLGDRVWFDTNANGIQDSGEPGLEKIGVTLLDGAGNVIGTTTTGTDGKYGFTGLLPGSYGVRFDPIGGYVRSAQGQGADRTLDSDANNDGNVSVTLNAGDNRTDIDAGYYAKLMLGDRVWFDVNANGVQDANEKGVANVVVRLLDGSGNPVLDASGNAITTKTDSMGGYLFGDLTPGSYKVKFDLPSGYTFTGRNVGSDPAVDSDADGSGLTDVIALTADNLSVDAGLYGTLCLGDRVWKDLNGNGLQDSCEPGVPGVTVHLIDASNTEIASTVTGANGIYNFPNLAPGDYTVKFDAPTGYGFTKQAADARYPTYDSNADPSTGVASITLSASTTTVDAGLIGALKLGDTVWLDCDGDGKFDVDQGEKGLKGIRVYLLGDTNGDGKADMAASAVTDANGHYLFLNLLPGTYQVTVNAFDLPKGVVQTTRYGSIFPYVGLGKLGPTTDNLDFDFGYKPCAPSVGCGHKWWSCNPSCWPWDCIWVGGKCHPKATVCAWMKRDDCGDKSICLYQRLCAAKLNVGNGCNEGKVYQCGKTCLSLKDAIKCADAWLAAHPVGCNVSGASRDWASICDVFAILDAHCNGK